MIKIKIVIDKLKINYLKTGTGKTVLIIPGWGTTIDTYMPLVNEIATYKTVFTLDMPGCGNSSEPKTSWNLDDYITFIIKFIENTKIKELDLIGHSNGGRIIAKLMSKKNLPFKVSKIILIGSAGIVHKRTIYQKIRINTFKFCKRIAKLSLISKLFPNLLTKVQNFFGSADYKNASPIMRETMVKLINEDIKKHLPTINVPTLLIWGENDLATPITDAFIMESLIPDAAVIKVPNTGHYVFLENPSYTNIIIKNFLNGGDL